MNIPLFVNRQSDKTHRLDLFRPDRSLFDLAHTSARPDRSAGRTWARRFGMAAPGCVGRRCPLE
jgi:hypothetical protein